MADLRAFKRWFCILTGSLLSIVVADTPIFKVCPLIKYFPVAAREGVFSRPRALQIEPRVASKGVCVGVCVMGGIKCRKEKCITS